MKKSTNNILYFQNFNLFVGKIFVIFRQQSDYILSEQAYGKYQVFSELFYYLIAVNLF